jgi:hypothetical protein
MMEKTLVKSSNILLEKSKFFVNRIVIYFSFLLVPVWIQKTVALPLIAQSFLLFLYLLFMGGQWYLLGKEIDHRFKIYFRANSSIDRILYRLVMGNAALMVIFNLMSFISDDIVNHFFWGFFVVVGLFYSWPTRGKIIEESVSTQFTEYRYLDSFEKTVLFMTIALLLISIPTIPFFDNLETLKLILDPDEKMNGQIWNFLAMNFYPFRKFPQMMNMALGMYFYFVGLTLYILSFYSILRYFISRRLSILGLFAVVSTWSFSLFLRQDLLSCFNTTFSILWVWSILWCAKSSTYRAGLMYGLLCYIGVIINYNFIFLFPVGLALIYMVALKEKTDWFRSQFVKYTFLGLILILITLITHMDLRFFETPYSFVGFKDLLKQIFDRKAFYALAFLGLITVLLHLTPRKMKLPLMTLDKPLLSLLLMVMVLIIPLALFVDQDFLGNFGALWWIAMLSIFPLEWIFQSLSRSRSRRNFIYMIYVLVCLLDSHVEGRFYQSYRFFNQRQSSEQNLPR